MRARTVAKFFWRVYPQKQWRLFKEVGRDNHVDPQGLCVVGGVSGLPGVWDHLGRNVRQGEHARGATHGRRLPDLRGGSGILALEAPCLNPRCRSHHSKETTSG